jgi:hypothetical protein
VAELSGLRFAFFLLVYGVTLLGGVDLFAFGITAPMFLAILASLAFTPKDRIGYVDGAAVVYFISFVIVPLQKMSGFTFVGGELDRGAPYPIEYFLIVAALALVSYIALVAFLRPRPVRMSPQRRTIEIPSMVILAVGVVLLAVDFLVAGSFENLLAPRNLRVAGDFDFAVVAIVALLSINAVFAILRRDADRTTQIAVASFACACLLVAANPWNLARFALFGAWIPVLLCIAPSMLRTARFYLAIPAVLLVALPVLSITTRFSSDRYYLLGDIFRGENSIFQISNFNLFELSCEAIRYVSRHGYEQGSVMVSTVLTFVPRAWWPGKPINGGLLIGYMNVDEGYTNQNLAEPFFMDGYMDFGIAGSIVYGITLAGLYALLRRGFAYRINGFDLYFLLFLANITILTRGTLAVVYNLFLFQLLFLFLYVKFFSRPAAGATQVPPATARYSRRP